MAESVGLGSASVGRISGAYVGRLAAFAVSWIAAVLMLAMVAVAGIGAPDAVANYLAGHGPMYVAGANLNTPNYIYPPPFAQVTFPLTQLPWQAFAVGWTVAMFGIFVWLLWPLPIRLRLPLLIAAGPIALAGSVNPILALSLVLAMRWPAAWAIGLLTKVTPGVGLVWYAVRREWRSLAIVLTVTGAIAAVSFAAAPQQWVAWISVILADSVHHAGIALVPLPPLPVRIVLAAVVVAWGARTSRAWTLAPAVILANPDVLLATFAVLAALPRLNEFRAA